MRSSKKISKPAPTEPKNVTGKKSSPPELKQRICSESSQVETKAESVPIATRIPTPQVTRLKQPENSTNSANSKNIAFTYEERELIKKLRKLPSAQQKQIADLVNSFSQLIA